MLPAGALARSIERADTDTRRSASDARGVDANGDGDGDDAREAVARGGARARANGATTPRAMDTEVRRARDPMSIITTREFTRRTGRDGARGARGARDFACVSATDVRRRADASMRVGARHARGDGDARRGRRATMEKRFFAMRVRAGTPRRARRTTGEVERGCACRGSFQASALSGVGRGEEEKRRRGDARRRARRRRHRLT
jgi:hypothetical protein